MTGRLGVTAAGLGLVAAACGGGSSTDRVASVEVFVPISSVELLADSLTGFESETGIAVRVTGTNSFVDDLVGQVDAGLPPDIAFIPQPGVVELLARSGKLVPLDEQTQAVLDESLDPRLRPLVEVDGTAVAFPVRLSVKSLVWYRPGVLADLGLDPPGDLEELATLVRGLTEEGLTPWCVGLEAGSATGWVATDWVEDLLLRRSGPAVYDRWVGGEVTFASDEVADAFAAFHELVLAPGLVSGGTAEVLRTSVERGVDGLFTEPVECVFHRQASFAYGWGLDQMRFGPDADLDFFVLPTVDDEKPPLVIGATVAVAFSERPETMALMRHLATPAATGAWADAGGFVSPHRMTVDPADEFGERLRAVLETAGTVRLDASDSMEPGVGSDLLWGEITRWVAGSTTHADLAARIDAARAETAPNRN